LRRPSLRSQLNQIRLWVRQGRTDAWIAHKLDISVEELRTFKRGQGLEGEPEPASAAASADEAVFDRPVEDEEDSQAVRFDSVGTDEIEEPLEETEPDREGGRDTRAVEEAQPEGRDEAEREAEQRETGQSRRRRRGRRGGRRRSSTRKDSFEATFDHGDEGYGLWLDPAVAETDVYSEHWAGHRAVSVTVEPDAITIRRVDDEAEDRDG
jgi:hypothetical protein